LFLTPDPLATGVEALLGPVQGETPASQGHSLQQKCLYSLIILFFQLSHYQTVGNEKKPKMAEKH